MRRCRWMFLLALLSGLAVAEIQPESMGVSTLADPKPTWLMVHDGLGPAYIFDSASGAMQGLLSLSKFTPAIEMNASMAEAYAAESYYSRGVRGERTDVLTIYDLSTLSPVAEVPIPHKIAALEFPQYIELMDDQRYVGVFNITPATSVSIVDVKERKFVQEISTPGCALIMATAGRGFLQICGDGSLQLVRLGADGTESDRIRSKKFFSVEEDPVFDKPIATGDGWLLTSYQGQVFEVSVADNQINITEPWAMLTDADDGAGWRPGGGQFIAYHAGQDLLFVLMNPGGEFAHDTAGTEVWVFNRQVQKRVAQLPLEHSGTNLSVSQDDKPLLTVTGEDGQLHVFDVATLSLVRTIAEVGVAPGLLQNFYQ